MHFSIQPVLILPQAALYPLQESDFDALYSVASDPAIWEQHPNRDRWKKEVFSLFFEGAMKSGGAFNIIEPVSGEVMGSTRFYDYKQQDDSIYIGYTFYAVKYWGKGINPAVKKAMLDYIFQFVSRVYFHVGSCNIRSQVAMERLGAVRLGEIDVAYFGEAPKMNVVYQIEKQNWR
jgi:RimJ/RimL family protein N-acetyltransferase